MSPDPKDPSTWLVSVTKELKAHPLWKDSVLEGFFECGGLTRKVLKGRINMYSGMDDLTANEQSFLKLLIEVEKNNSWT